MLGFFPLGKIRDDKLISDVSFIAVQDQRFDGCPKCCVVMLANIRLGKGTYGVLLTTITNPSLLDMSRFKHPCWR
jgi:hypothetical protein